MRKYVVAAALLLFSTVGADAQCLLTFQTEVLAPFFVNRPGNFQIEAVSGNEPYRFSVYNDTLPDGFVLTPSGRLIGVPREELDTVVFVTVTDADGCHLTQAFVLVVFPESGPPA